ncbi:putative toxin-antitoxin system toxin component, PIN family [Elusimicrobiota bacterium]
MKPDKLRTVLDTNVVISSLLFDGECAPIADALQGKKFHFLASGEITTEYLRVLTYPKFQLKDDEIKGIWQSEILPFLVPVKVAKTKKIIKEDPGDDDFLACAKYGRADFLVTGDRHLLKLERYGKTKIVRIKEFMGVLE